MRIIKWGYSLQFTRRPPRFSGVVSTSVQSENAHVLRLEVMTLLEKGAIERVPPAQSESGFYSRYFLVPKKDGVLRPILDLRCLNHALMRRLFRMITLKQILSQIRTGDWFFSLDLKDAHFHIQITPHHIRFLRFAFEGVAYSVHGPSLCTVSGPPHFYEVHGRGSFTSKTDGNPHSPGGECVRCAKANRLSAIGRKKEKSGKRLPRQLLGDANSITVCRACQFFLPDLIGQYVLIHLDNMSVVSYINHQGGLSSKHLFILVEHLLFAFKDSSHCPTYYLKVRDVYWPNLLLYAFPPIVLIPKAVRWIREQGRKVLLVAPLWENQPWLSELTQLLVAAPWPMPLRRDLLSQANGTIWHPLPELFTFGRSTGAYQPPRVSVKHHFWGQSPVYKRPLCP